MASYLKIILGICRLFVSIFYLATVNLEEKGIFWLFIIGLCLDLGYFIVLGVIITFDKAQSLLIESYLYMAYFFCLLLYILLGLSPIRSESLNSFVPFEYSKTLYLCQLVTHQVSQLMIMAAIVWNSLAAVKAQIQSFFVIGFILIEGVITCYSIVQVSSKIMKKFEPDNRIEFENEREWHSINGSSGDSSIGGASFYTARST
ncbi:unnamed protein product [Blepharisma stoltei]|uniref:Uncharacterized protein n=1 Tax=Blepharisma stoltei TaxID=1481888 RepID=A0AAU9JFG7_9CILI|nr:unnamed protein product [Blepharisma stoltei]